MCVWGGGGGGLVCLCGILAEGVSHSELLIGYRCIKSSCLRKPIAITFSSGVIFARIPFL